MALLLTVLFYTTTLGLFLGFPFHYGRPSLLSKRVLPPGAEDCQEYLFWNKIKRAADDRVAEDERAQPNEDMQFGRSYYFNASVQVKEWDIAGKTFRIHELSRPLYQELEETALYALIVVTLVDPAIESLRSPSHWQTAMPGDLLHARVGGVHVLAHDAMVYREDNGPLPEGMDPDEEEDPGEIIPLERNYQFEHYMHLGEDDIVYEYVDSTPNPSQSAESLYDYSQLWSDDVTLVWHHGTGKLYVHDLAVFTRSLDLLPFNELG